MRRFIAYIGSALIIGGLGLGAIEMYNHEYRDAKALYKKIQDEGFKIGLDAANNRQHQAYLEERDRLDAAEILRNLKEACEKDAERLLGE